MTGSKNDNPAKDLQDFWIEIAESSHNIIPDMFSYEYDDQNYELDLKRSSSASLNAATFGIPKFFVPRWFNWKTLLQMILIFCHHNGLISMIILH